MAFSYARMKATADRLIASAGQAAILRRPSSSGPAHNPTQGAPTDYATTIVVDSYRQHEIDGERIRRDDLKVLLAKASLTVEPATSDKLVIGGIVYAIVDVRPVNPGGVVLYYEIQARR